MIPSTRLLNRNAANGFTIIELLVVLAILGVLSTLVMPLAELGVQRDRERELKRALWQIRDAIDNYHVAAMAGRTGRDASVSAYPPSLGSLVSPTMDATAPGGVRYFLRRLPRDPFADPGLPAEETWSVRSYLSPADDPKPGADVFDVASKSKLLSLTGQPLKEW